MGGTLSREEVEERIKAVHKGKVKLIGDYRGLTFPATLKCKVGHIWEANLVNVTYNKSGCPQCWAEKRARNNKSRMKTTESYAQELIDKGSKWIPLEDYKGAHTKILHQCICGVIEKRTPNHLIYLKECQDCSYITRTKAAVKKQKRVYKSLLEQLAPSIRCISYSYASNNVARFKCLDCKYKWIATKWAVLELRPWCPRCKPSRGYKEYKFSDVRSELVLGYEPWALDFLLKQGINPKSILCGQNGRQKIPVFRYTFKGVEHRFYPDIKVDDKIYEVKSDWTMYSTRDLFRVNKAKFKSASKTYNVEFLVFDDKGKLIQLPDNWYKISYKKFMNLIERNRYV